MGMDYLIVNLDKKQYIHPYYLGDPCYLGVPSRVYQMLTREEAFAIICLLCTEWIDDRILTVLDQTDLWNEVKENYVDVYHKTWKAYQEYNNLIKRGEYV